jgi:hypothetical protein
LDWILGSSPVKRYLNPFGAFCLTLRINVPPVVEMPSSLDALRETGTLIVADTGEFSKVNRANE